MTRHVAWPIVAVDWKDAHGSATATYAVHEIPHAAVLITTIGFLLRQDAEGVSIAGEYTGQDEFRGVTFVPAEMIVAIRSITRTRKRSSVTSRQDANAEGAKG